jgi:hypothetical protein
MPKRFQHESVLHDWVCNLSFQQQALLMTAMRGPDGLEKHNTAKAIVRYLRGIVLKPAGAWANHKTMPVGKNDNDFMWGEYDYFESWAKGFFDDHDGYPHHFTMHLIHCAEVVGYKHPIDHIRHAWFTFYVNMCKAMHMGVESEAKMDERLNDFGESQVQPLDPDSRWDKEVFVATAKTIEVIQERNKKEDGDYNGWSIGDLNSFQDMLMERGFSIQRIVSESEINKKPPTSTITAY